MYVVSIEDSNQTTPTEDTLFIKYLFESNCIYSIYWCLLTYHLVVYIVVYELMYSILDFYILRKDTHIVCIVRHVRIVGSSSIASVCCYCHC